MIKKIYLDTNIFVSYYASNGNEVSAKKAIIGAFETFANSDVELYTSMWAITEMIKVLVKEKKMEIGDVVAIESELINEKRIHDVKIQILNVSPKEDYEFSEFFYHIRKKALIYKSGGIADMIHSVIMENNGISTILTMDNDFEEIPDLTVINPKNRIEKF